MVRYGTRFCVRERGSIDLVLDVTNTSLVPVYFGPSVFGCSAANLINRVTISSRSGSILEKIDRASQLSAIRVLYEHDRTWRLFGPGTAAGTSDTLAGLDWQPNTTLRFCIPLGVISPLLGSIDTLLPAQLCSGLKFELVLSSAEEALVSGGATDVLSYEIANARFERKVICYPTSCFDRLIPPHHLQASNWSALRFLTASLSVQHRPSIWNVVSLQVGPSQLC
jgi:hypothetical protein